MESISPSDWLPDSPFRSPARRWLRASWLLDQGKRAKLHFDDDGVRRAKRFLSACGSDAKGQAMARKADPALADALQLFCNEHSHKKWRLESYLLTTEPLETAAARCSVSLATAQSYHDIFFDVRPYLAARDWIWLRAIRAGAWNCFARDFPGSLWKGFAYNGGPLALEFAVALTTDSPLPGWVRDTLNLACPDEEARLLLRGKFAVAALITESPTELAALVEARRQFRGMECQTPEGRGETDGLAKAMEKFLKCVGGRVTKKRKAAVETPKARKQTRDHITKRKARQASPVASLVDSGC
jgi:hypothetical protein